MSAYTVRAETVPDQENAVHYAWVVEWEGGGTGFFPVTTTAGEDPVSAAQVFDPRNRDYGKNARAVLVKVVVPLSELRTR